MEHTISCLMAQLCKTHRNAANIMLNEAGLHVGQEMVLLQLWQQDGLTQRELAEQLCVEAPTVTRMLQRMQRCGLIERRSDPEDRRVSRVYLTERSSEMQPAVQQCWANLEARVLAGISSEERLLLHGLLTKMLANLQNSEEDKIPTHQAESDC